MVYKCIKDLPFFFSTQIFLLMLQKLLPFYDFQRLSTFFVLLSAFPSLQKKIAWTRTFRHRLLRFKSIEDILYKNGLKMSSAFDKVSEYSGFVQSQNTRRYESVGPCRGQWAPRTPSDYWIFQSREAVTCQTRRWLCSAMVGCWSAADSDKPSSSPPSSPAEEDDEPKERCARRRWQPFTGANQTWRRSPGSATHSPNLKSM